MQKAVFWRAKGGLLAYDLPSFTTQKAVFYKTDEYRTFTIRFIFVKIVSAERTFIPADNNGTEFSVYLLS